MSAGETILSCPAPYGAGGLGGHLAQIVEEVRAAGDLAAYFAVAVKPGDPVRHEIRPRWLPFVCRITPARFRPDWQGFLGGVAFDRGVARQLPPARQIIGFAGASLQTFRRARALGYKELHLESGSAHVRHARRLYDAARRTFRIEHDWLGERLLARILAEYQLADVIWVNSEYSRETFVREGVPGKKIRRRILTVDPRFQPASARPANKGLHVVYVGSLSVSKGVPVLIEAFSHYVDPDARMLLVGGSGSRGMNRYLQAALRQDSRIHISPGDPLPHIQSADVCVHPSYSDGFGYGPAEALACGLPLIVTEDTGMKELIQNGQNGWIVPTGEWRPILQHLKSVRERLAHEPA